MWLSHSLISAHQKEMSGLCGFHVVSLMWFFLASRVFCSGLLWLYFCWGVSFSLRETSQAFRWFSAPQKNDSSLTEQGGQLNVSPSLHTARPRHSSSSSEDHYTTGDLNHRFALNKTVSANQGIRDTEKTTHPCDSTIESILISDLTDVWRHSSKTDMVVNVRWNCLWGKKEKINP